MINRSSVSLLALRAGFFLTSVADKNSSTKLKEKTQPKGGTFLLLGETQEKNYFFPKNF